MVLDFANVALVSPPARAAVKLIVLVEAKGNKTKKTNVEPQVSDITIV